MKRQKEEMGREEVVQERKGEQVETSKRGKERDWMRGRASKKTVLAVQGTRYGMRSEIHRAPKFLQGAAKEKS